MGTGMGLNAGAGIVRNLWHDSCPLTYWLVDPAVRRSAFAAGISVAACWPVFAFVAHSDDLNLRAINLRGESNVSPPKGAKR